MTKAKKVLSLVLAVVMVAAMFAFSASAATQNATFTVSVDKTSAAIDDVVTVTVKLTTSYYAGPTNVPVYYNPAVFEFVADSVSGADIFGAGATDIQSYNDATTGCLKVAFVPDAGAGATTQVLTDVTLVTFQLKAIANGTSDIGLKAEDQKTETNITGTLYCGAYESDVIDNNPATVGQVFTINNTSATVGSATEPADLALTAAGTEAGVLIDTNKTFGGQYAGVVYGFTQVNNATFRSTTYLTTNLEATNGGSLEFGRSIGTAGYGTGTTITVKNADDSDTGKVYVVVIFGDVNGDGLINGQDTTALKAAVTDSSKAPANSVVRMAANCQNVNNATVMHNLNGQDTTALKNHVQGSAKLDPVSLATKQNNFNTFYQ
ncbi:MAG: cohesin domain-containing protein [Candidatus Fimenecus sp.]